MHIKTKQNVLGQLAWIDHCNYEFYTKRNSNGPAAVFVADVTRLLDEVDWADKSHEVDTDEMQISLNAVAANYTDLPTLLLTVDLVIIDPIRKWSVAPPTLSFGPVIEGQTIGDKFGDQS